MSALTLGGKRVSLALPTSYALASEVVFSATSNPRRALAAALGVCLRGPGRVPIKYESYGWDPLAYGGAVIDALHERGVPESEIWPMAQDAMALLANSVVGDSEVKAAEGNGDGEEEPSKG